VAEGPIAGKKMPRETQDYMLDRYYELRGWDKNGVPEAALTEKMGLGGWMR
jgi:aldehyde:ferredoxin oxidoreductase